MPTPKVGIVTLNWENYKDTSRFLNSLKQLETTRSKIYIVDNSSSDDSADRLDQEYPYKVIRNDENVGFAAGMNTGIRRALYDGARYILIANNDLVMSEPIIQELVNGLNSIPNAVISGCLIERYKSDEVWYAGGVINDWLARTRHKNTPPSKTIYETEYVTGALMMIDGEWIKGQLFNEDYFFGFEDVEICRRAREQGYRVIVNPEARVKHDVSSTAGQRSPFKFYNAARNRIRWSQEQCSSVQSITFAVFFIFSRIVRFSQWFCDDRDLIKATSLGIYDELTDRPYRKPNYFPS